MSNDKSNLQFTTRLLRFSRLRTYKCRQLFQPPTGCDLIGIHRKLWLGDHGSLRACALMCTKEVTMILSSDQASLKLAEPLTYSSGVLCLHRKALKKTTSQHVWPRINSNKWIKTARSAVSKNPRFFFEHQPRNFDNVTLVARQRVHFRGFWAIFFVAQLPPKRGVLVHKNLLATYQRCSHSVEPRALMCPFKQRNLSAWSYPNL